MSDNPRTDLRYQLLTALIQKHGPVPVSRVSSARGKGKARDYPYWGIADYEIRPRKKDGVLIIAVVRGASSERRSEALARKDLLEHCLRQSRLPLLSTGSISPRQAAYVLHNTTLRQDKGWELSPGHRAQLDAELATLPPTKGR